LVRALMLFRRDHGGVILEADGAKNAFHWLSE